MSSYVIGSLICIAGALIAVFAVSAPPAKTSAERLMSIGRWLRQTFTAPCSNSEFDQLLERFGDETRKDQP